MLDPAAMARVRSSFQLVSPQGKVILAAFYDALATTAPETRALFPADPAVNASLMVDALALVAQHVDHPDALVEPLNKLSGKRVKFAAKSQHVPAIREALLAALADATDPIWTPQLAADWSAAIEAAARVVTHPAPSSKKPHATRAAA